MDNLDQQALDAAADWTAAGARFADATVCHAAARWNW